MKSKHAARPVASNSGLSYTQKISLTAGSLSALYLLPTGAQASIVYVANPTPNDTPGGSIRIADTGSAIPEPSTPALTLLGLGAAGLRAWRARKRA